MNGSEGPRSDRRARHEPGPVEAEAASRPTGDRCALYIVASRLPVEYDPIEGWRRSPGGLVSALEPVLVEAAGWFGETRPGQPPPPARIGQCELIELPVSTDDQELAHDGFCNRTLWPALHGIGGNVEQHSEWWDAWRRRTAVAAEVVARTATQGAAVWVHDYHFFGLATPLRRLRPDLRVGLSCHTPIDEVVLARLTHSRELTRDLTDFELITVQTERDRTELDRWLANTRRSNNRPVVIANPVGFDVESWIARRHDQVVVSLAERHRSPGGVLVAGVDRIDYTKGLLHKLHAIEVLLARGQIGPDDVRFVQIAVPSRTSIRLYRYLARQMEETATRINADFPRSDGRAVVTLIQDQIAPRQVAGLMRAADIALVTPARDGMNLVALEFAVLNGDRPFELILSRGAGAVDHIGRWCRLVDGTDVIGTADAITDGIAALGGSESADRARRRAAAASALTAERWTHTFLEGLAPVGSVTPDTDDRNDAERQIGTAPRGRDHESATADHRARSVTNTEASSTRASPNSRSSPASDTTARPHPIAPHPEPSRLEAEPQTALAGEVEWHELAAALPQIVWVTRPDGYHVYFNEQWMNFTGLTLAESLGDGWNPPFHPDDRPLARRLWAEATRTGDPYEIEYRLRRHDGVYRWMLGRAVPLRNESGEVVKWFGTCTDIEDLKSALDDAAELREELERRATHDSLTGLANRDLLFNQMERMLHQSRRAGVAVVFIDLDRFKEINDRLGHRAGDQVLVHVARRLRAVVRQGDVAARIGGDEFVVVGEADDPEDADRIGQRVVAAVGGCFHLEGEYVEVAASVGVAYVAAGDAPSADVVLAHADARMYEAKRHR